MQINIINEEKGKMDIEIDNLTIVELMRNYLNKESGVKLAAWRREHPSKNPILHIEADNPKAVAKKAIVAVQKDLDKYSKEFKAMK